MRALIKEFKDNEMRDFGNVYQSMLTQIKKRYAKDPVQAGELAISFIEYVLTGDISSDDDIIEGFVEGYKITTQKNQNKYDAKVAATRDALQPIADMYNKGMTQADIARALGVQPPAVSKKMNTIRTQFPDLLIEDRKDRKVRKVSEISGNVGNIGNVSKCEGKFPETLETLNKVSENLGNIGKDLESLETFPSFQSFHNNNNNNYNNNNNNNYENSSSPEGESGLRLEEGEKRPKFDF